VKVAVVATVRNEAEHLPEFLASMAAQWRSPDQLVIVDDGSTDDTRHILDRFALSSTIPTAIYHRLDDGGNRSLARNTGIGLAGDADVVAVASAAEFGPDWLSELVAPIEGGKADVTGSALHTVTRTTRDYAMALLTVYSPEQGSDAVFPCGFIAFRKDDWAALGGYREDLRTSEDTDFECRLRERGLRMRFVRSAVARWRPGPLILRAVFDRFREYARTDAVARFKWREQYFPTFFFYSWLAAMVVVELPLFTLPSLLAWLAFRSRKVIGAMLLRELPYVFAGVVAIDLGRMLGYIEGVSERK